MTSTNRQDLLARANALSDFVAANPGKLGNVGRIIAARALVNLAMGELTQVTTLNDQLVAEVKKEMAQT